MKIEDLLLNIDKVKTITESNAYETLKQVLSEQVRPLVEDHLLKEDENIDLNLPYDEEEVTSDGGELPTDDMPVDDLSPDMSQPTELPTDMTADSDLDLTDADTDTDVLDLSDATFDEVMAAIKDLPDDTEIVIKKNTPTFDVDVNGAMDNDDAGEMFDESEIFESDESDSLYESIISEQKNIIQEYETKLNKLQSQVENQQKIVLEFQNKQKNYDAVLLESHKSLEHLLVYNTNLTNITKLFTEQTVTKSEKLQIIEQFQKAETVNESKLLYETYANNLKKTPINESVSKIKEEISTQKIISVENKEKVLIKEQKTYSDPALSMFDRVTKHKI